MSQKQFSSRKSIFIKKFTFEPKKIFESKINFYKNLLSKKNYSRGNLKFSMKNYLFELLIKFWSKKIFRAKIEIFGKIIFKPILIKSSNTKFSCRNFRIRPLCLIEVDFRVLCFELGMILGGIYIINHSVSPSGFFDLLTAGAFVAPDWPILVPERTENNQNSYRKSDVNNSSR